MKRVLLALSILVVIGAVAAAVLWQQYNGFRETALDLPEDGLVIMLEPGETYPDLVRKLSRLGVTEADWRWRLFGRLTPAVASMKAGEYRLVNLTPVSLIDLLVSGKTMQHSLTVVEGWSLRELMQALSENEILIQTIEESDPGLLASNLSLDYPHAEGLFLPETYQFPRGTRDTEFLKRAHEDLLRVLNHEWQNRADGLPYSSAYDALIMASIIEKETAVDHEREQIAGVFVRRLQRKMRLQTDPTVIYGIGADFDGDIRFRDLRTDTPYNTYTRHGLPPTPIAMPGPASIRAALHPADGDTLYFVSRGDGSHQFSATLEEHNAAVQKYQRGGP